MSIENLIEQKERLIVLFAMRQVQFWNGVNSFYEQNYPPPVYVLNHNTELHFNFIFSSIEECSKVLLDKNNYSIWIVSYSLDGGTKLETKTFSILASAKIVHVV